MKKLKAIPASDGIAIGKIAKCVRLDDKITKRRITDAAAELERLKAAQDQAVQELNRIYMDALQRIGEQDSMIFQIHIMMLQDDDFFDAIQVQIREENLNAEYAVWQTAQQYSAMFANMEDEYMCGRAADVIDISKRLLSCLDSSLGTGLGCLQEEVIVAANELMPSETVQMDRTKVLAIVTQKGSKNSHSAILARTLNIPALVGILDDFKILEDGEYAIVDGSRGELILSPDEETLRAYRSLQNQLLSNRQTLEKLKGVETVSKDGIHVEINANIGHPKDIDMVLENDAEGIGLFRSEFLYMDTADYPSEEMQFNAYREVLERMEGKRVIIRTLDLGADKKVGYFNLPEEDNPAMGYRAIRICLDRPDVFHTQLRALWRASAFGRLAVMFPMITSVEQVREIKKHIETIKNELTEEGVPMAQDVEVGIMIETPASAILSAELACEVDFFSIGTNDLTQYTLAADRMNPKIADLYDPRHPAVLELIRITAESAAKAGIWVGICGESAADSTLTQQFLRMGVRELSVAPSSVLELRHTIREMKVY